MTRKPARRRANPRLAGAWTAVMVLVGALASCTGTFEEGAPLVLLVATAPASTGDGGAIVAYLVEPPGAATLRSVTPIGPTDLAPDLTLPIRAWDWVDRDALAVGAGLGRTTLVVLASDTTSASAQRRASLHRYDLAGFDPATPTLSPVGPAPVSLVVDGAWDDTSVPIDEGVLLPNDEPCLTGASVSREGRYVALLDEPSACGQTLGDASLLLLDLDGPTLVWASPVEGVAPVAPYIDQRSDLLDVWRLSSSGTEWRRLDVASRAMLDEPTQIGDVLVAVAPAGEERWVLAGGRLSVWRPNATPSAGVASATSAAGRFVATGVGLPAVLLAPDLWVHPTPSAEPLRVQGASGTYVAGVTDAPDRLTYLVRAGVIDTLDLLVLTPDAPLSSVISPAFRDPSDDPRLTNPRLVTWFRPRPPPTP